MRSWFLPSTTGLSGIELVPSSLLVSHFTSPECLYREVGVPPDVLTGIHHPRAQCMTTSCYYLPEDCLCLPALSITDKCLSFSSLCSALVFHLTVNMAQGSKQEVLHSLTAGKSAALPAQCLTFGLNLRTQAEHREILHQIVT